jgi:carbon-monoxide dehydrogenase medium subunit
MIPAPFQYQAPQSLEEALELLHRYPGEARILAGGQSLIPLMKLRLAQPKVLVDLQRVLGLSYLREEGKFLKVGSFTRVHALLEDPMVRARYPMLTDAGGVIADPLVRNLGTVGGNLCHGDPGNDLPACWIAAGGEMVILGAGGLRTVAASAFYHDTFVTEVGPEEVLTEARLPLAGPGQGAAYGKLERPGGDFSVAGVAASLRLDPRGRVVRAGIGLTAVGPTALPAPKAAASLVGKPPDASHLAEAARLASQEAKPAADLRGDADHKRAVVEILAQQVLQKAAERARGAP